MSFTRSFQTSRKNCDADLFSPHTEEGGLYLEYDGEKNDNRVPAAGAGEGEPGNTVMAVLDQRVANLIFNP